MTKEKRVARPLTEQRKQVFLEHLAQTGSIAAAAAAATPWSEDAHGGASTFRDARNRDPAFAAAWERAEEAALALVEAELMRRAMTPERRPVFSKGELVGHHETYDNRLLLRIAGRLNPDAWIEKRAIEHTGAVEHKHGHIVVALEARDILLLPESRRASFMADLEYMADAKEAPDALEHKAD